MHRSDGCLHSTSFTGRALAVALAASLLLAGCGQGGGGSAEDAADAGATGSVSVFLTDAPGDEFDRILIDIEGITLIGGGPQVEIFTGSVTVDLLDLENFSDLFVHADEVPARKYKKLRLKVSRIQLVREGEDGEVIEVDPPANGKIDLLAPGGIEVRPGVDCVIEIDLDAKESIDRNGNGRYRFRPVVKIEVRDSLSPRKLARVHGTIRHVFDAENFVLCPTMFLASRDVLESREPHDEGGIGDRRRCVTVELDGRTGVFDSNGVPAEGAGLEEGDRVTVVGRFHLVDRHHDEAEEADPMDDIEGEGDAYAAVSGAIVERDFEHRRHRDEDDGEDEDDDDDDRRPAPVKLVLLAFVIEEGPAGTFLRLAGTVQSELEASGEFGFAIAPGQGFGSGSEVTSLVQPGTRVFSRQGIEVRPSALAPDLRALIDGVFSLGDGASFFRTALIMLDIVPPMPDVVRGKIEDIEAAQRRLYVAVASDEEDSAAPVDTACVEVAEDARILIIRERDDLTTTGEGRFEDLTVGMHVRATGLFGANDCLQARSLVAFDPGPPIVECADNGDCDRSEYCARREGRCDERGVCVVRPQICPAIYDPVCGCDGETYGNACEAADNGVAVDTEGMCEDDPIVCGGFPATPCPDGMVCEFRPGQCNIADAPGGCVEEPEVCPEIYDPVCSCDGVTYDNRCEALIAGAFIDRVGECEPRPCGGIAGLECGEGEVCVFEDGQCLSDAAGICQPAPQGCPRIYRPVCGCDGLTYGNRCEARAAGVAVQHAGTCEAPCSETQEEWPAYCDPSPS